MTGEPGTERRALAWLAHPVSLAGLVLLLINDHVLKQGFPGPVTGKLSDVAGLLFAPALLAVVLSFVVPGERLAVTAIATTGGLFAVVKTSMPAAAVASDAWSILNGPSTVLADPTDLVALPALVLSWWVWKRTAGSGVSSRAVRLFRVGVVLPVAVLAVAATSAPDKTEAGPVLTADGTILISETRSGSDSFYSSVDGVGWHRLTYEESKDFQDRSGAERDCLSEHCYRVVPGRLAVEQSDDSGTTWSIGWEVSEPDRRRLAREYYELGDPDVHLACRSLAVQPVSGGHIVVAGCGRAGYVKRTVDGQWERLSFHCADNPTTGPTPTATGSSASDCVRQVVTTPLVGSSLLDPVDLVRGAVVAWIVTLAGLELAAERRRRRSALYIVGLSLGGGGLALSVAIWVLGESTLSAAPLPVLALPLLLPGFGLWLSGAIPRLAARWAAPPILALGVASGAAAFWLRFEDPGWTVVAAAVGVLLAAAVGLISRRARRSRPASTPAVS